MAFQVSPGVVVQEKDLSSVIPSVSTSIGAIVIDSSKGPVNEITMVSTETELVSIFGKPTSENASSWYTAANFLKYGTSLKVVRATSSSAKNASGTAGVIVNNVTQYEDETIVSAGEFAAKTAGTWGNSLRVDICSSSAAFSGWAHEDIFDIAPGTTEYASAVGGSRDELYIVVVDEDGEITGTAGTVLEKFITSKCKDAKSITGASMYYVDMLKNGSSYIYQMEHPTTTDTVANQIATTSIVAGGTGGTNGTFTVAVSGGTGGTISVVIGGGVVTAASIISGGEGYTAGSVPAALLTALGLTGADITFTVSTVTSATSSSFGDVAKSFVGSDDAAVETFSLAYGVDSVSVASSDMTYGLQLFADAETVDINLLISGPADPSHAQACMNVADARKDCIAFISPEKSDVVGITDSNTQATNVKTFFDALNSSSYTVFDSGWKYQYDAYNDNFVWVPLNGDIAGCCANTDDVADPWFSPAGYTRGNIKSVTKLAFNPKKSHRDTLYKARINPVVTFPGVGTVLWGDKTAQTKASAFDRINVRRLFITMEKAISNASKSQLFELNDEITRSNFLAMVEPFLRGVQGRRGITDFKVVCDESNNTGNIIDTNQFIADIYVKPARSINFITLTFVATRTGVSFSEVGA